MHHTSTPERNSSYILQQNQVVLGLIMRAVNTHLCQTKDTLYDKHRLQALSDSLNATLALELAYVTVLTISNSRPLDRVEATAP